ncbi:MAG: DUF433 domain-containing protein [Candidatus Korarchaeota archaeon]|nr:DUF433 domain-containing protein [Candidatus Korarchaeota archaeon]
MVSLPGYEWLEVVPGRRGGRPTVKGTRVSVDDILEALANGWSVDEVAENYRIPVEAVREALKYALERLRKIEVVTIEATS